ALIAHGLSNADIAERLVLTTGTVANHVASILQRLDLESRTQIATWAVEAGLYDRRDRFLTTLEQLLEVQPSGLVDMDHVARLVARALDADLVAVFLHDVATDTLAAVGASYAPLRHDRAATGLDRVSVAGGGRTGQGFLPGAAHIGGDIPRHVEGPLGVRR